MTDGYSELNAKKRLISPRILKRIDEKYQILSEDPYYDEELKRKECKLLFQESTVNSARLEEELVNLQNTGTNGKSRPVSKKKVEDEARNLGKKVQEAWIFACRNYQGKITEELIGGIGHIIDPFANPSSQLRTGMVQVGGRSAFTPDKLRLFLPRYLEELNDGFVYLGKKSEDSERLPINSVEKAAYAHLSMFIMQPCSDGNKRVGRTLQNLILQEAKLPPPIIYSAESPEYISKLCAARMAFDERGSTSSSDDFSQTERDFFDYIGTKVLISLDRMNDALSKDKKFKIELVANPSHRKETYLSAKHALQSLLRKRDPQGQVRLGEAELILRGNITESDIGAVLDSLKQVNDYKISPYRKI